MPISKYLDNGAFGPDEITILRHAFEAALDALGLVDRTDPAVELVARKIVHFAQLGERDPKQLCLRVVLSFSGSSIEA